jgi:DNA-binding NarL/FixJ family response regulator
MVADDLQHPIDRRQRRERKGDQQQPEQRQGQRQQSLKQREQGVLRAAARGVTQQTWLFRW